jgi:hypothetical protein
MDFLDPKKRKSNQRRLFIGYGLMAVLVTMVSVLLLLQAYGYSYNIRTGNITQNGLLFVDAHPVPATLLLNGESRGLTDKRLVLTEGKYDIALQRDGYHSWNTSVLIKGGVIERFLYPFLFPVDIVSTEVELFSGQPSFVTQSPDRQWLVTSLPGTVGGFEVLNLSDETPAPARFQLPGAVFTSEGETHNMTLVEWSTNNRHFVFRHQFDGGEEFILVDHQQPSEAQNLSTLITQPFTSMKLRDKKFDSYYLHDAPSGALLQFDLATTEVTPLLEHVLAFHPHGDDELLYVTDDGVADKPNVALRMKESGTTYTIRELVRSKLYLLDLAQYEGNWYLVVAPTSDDKVYVFYNPIAILNRGEEKIIPESVLRVDDVRKVSFSQNARIIAAEGKTRLGVYDAERKATFHYDSKLKLAEGVTFNWMDGHRLTAVAEGTQHVFDFDGKNRRTLGSGYDTSVPYFDRDYTAVFTIAPSQQVENRAALLRTELIVEEQ